MPIVFVHGVNTRNGPAYDAGVKVTKGYLKEREVVANDRRLLAEANYERVDFKRGIRNDRRQRAV